MLTFLKINNKKVFISRSLLLLSYSSFLTFPLRMIYPAHESSIYPTAFNFHSVFQPLALRFLRLVFSRLFLYNCRLDEHLLTCTGLSLWFYLFLRAAFSRGASVSITSFHFIQTLPYQAHTPDDTTVAQRCFSSMTAKGGSPIAYLPERHVLTHP